MLFNRITYLYVREKLLKPFLAVDGMPNSIARQ